MTLAGRKLKVARYRFRFKTLTSIQLPDYSGSMLRGAFGHALMLLSGIDKQDIKTRSAFYKSSPYAAVFEPINDNGEQGWDAVMDSVVRYCIEPPSNGGEIYQVGDRFEFDMVLIGEALSCLNVVILAWRRALLHGLGKQKAEKAELVEVLHHNDGKLASIYSDVQPVVLPHCIDLETPSFLEPKNLHLSFYTALRLRHQGKHVGFEELTAPLLLRNIIRRASIVMKLLNFEEEPNFDVQPLNELADSVEATKQLRLKSWRRYSSRQKQMMTLDGYVGDWWLEQVPAELLPYIWLGQYLHVGKNTSFGLGGYKILTMS